MATPPQPPVPRGQTILNTPAARFVVHVLFMFAGVFFALLYASPVPTSHAALYAAFAAAARAVVGALTSTNPGVGVNLL